MRFILTFLFPLPTLVVAKSLSVVASILPLQALIGQMGGVPVNARAMVGLGDNPCTGEPMLPQFAAAFRS